MARLALMLPPAVAASHTRAQAPSDDGTRAGARNLAAEGIEAHQAGDFQRASQKLDKAYRLFATPTLALWSTRAAYQRGRWVEAAERILEVQLASADVDDAATQRQAQHNVGDELAALIPRLPTLTIPALEHEPAGPMIRQTRAREPGRCRAGRETRQQGAPKC
jgi:hypothetical protein